MGIKVIGKWGLLLCCIYFYSKIITVLAMGWRENNLLRTGALNGHGLREYLKTIKGGGFITCFIILSFIFLTLFLSGCKHKKPAFIWTNNRCDDQWVQFDDGSYDVPYPGAAAGAQHLTVPCTPSPDVNGMLVWMKRPYK